MNLEKQELAELISTVVKETITQLGIGKAEDAADVGKAELSAYDKTEQLLLNYPNFKRIVQERMEEVEEIKRYGVPKKTSGFEYNPHGNVAKGIVLMEESVDAAVRTVQASVQGTVQAISLIDKGMAALKSDPYYAILEMRYINGYTQEAIALELGCSQKTISQNKDRLIRELAMRLFPDQVVREIIG
jgi:DNA-directed RNA polymerase specialized sigma subunit